MSRCSARFIIEILRDAQQDRRMRCAREVGHRGRHHNEANDLAWQDGAEISLRDVLG